MGFRVSCTHLPTRAHSFQIRDSESCAPHRNIPWSFPHLLLRRSVQYNHCLPLLASVSMPSSRASSAARSRRGTSIHGRRQSSISSHSSRSSLPKKATSHWQSGAHQKRHTTASITPLSQPASTVGSVTPQPVHRRPPRDSDDADEIQGHVIMAVDVKEKGKVGCTYYISREERLLCMEDSLKGGIEMIERCR